MMSETEVELVGYVQGILRSRGYAELAEQMTFVVEREVGRRARLLAPPPPIELRAAG